MVFILKLASLNLLSVNIQVLLVSLHPNFKIIPWFFKLLFTLDEDVLICKGTIITQTIIHFHLLPLYWILSICNCNFIILSHVIDYQSYKKPYLMLTTLLHPQFIFEYDVFHKKKCKNSALFYILHESYHVLHSINIWNELVKIILL